MSVPNHVEGAPGPSPLRIEEWTYLNPRRVLARLAPLLPQPTVPKTSRGPTPTPFRLKHFRLQGISPFWRTIHIEAQRTGQMKNTWLKLNRNTRAVACTRAGCPRSLALGDQGVHARFPERTSPAAPLSPIRFFQNPRRICETVSRLNRIKNLAGFTVSQLHSFCEFL
jgi:hypothetical protein